MRKLSLDRIYGCSTAYRHSIIGLPQNRVAFIAGSYLVILDCSTNEQRYLSFSAIEFLYISPSGLLMGIIDHVTQDGDNRIHIYSTQPIDLLYTIEPDRFGSFIGITINHKDNILMILHSEPAYMITIQEIQIEFDEQHTFHMIDLASVRVVHGSVINRMTKKEIVPHVALISFCPYSTILFCATGSALFKIYEIDNQNVNQQIVHFRAEFYVFTCHCWLDINSILVNTLRKRYNAIIDRMESRDIERSDTEKEVEELHNQQFESVEKLDHFRLIIKKKEDRIGGHDLKLHRLQQHILHVEKRKYVLDYKTKSLLERIEPMDQEIIRLKTNNENIEQQLTILKRQQNDLISRENEYEIKVNQLFKQLNLAKRNHQYIWKIVKRQKDVIKKAFEFAEINCTLDTTMSSREQLKNFIREMCETMQNEQQTENQLEIQGFMKEWNNQRSWLLNQLHDLTKHTEENKQTFINIQREHRKAIAPFINQLRDLHNLFDEIQKKIQKRLSILKIKANEQTEFLQNISDVLHGNEKIHLTINKLSQNELLIQNQDKEIQRLASIIFRYQYSTPCLESFNQTKLIQHNESNTTIPFSVNK